MHKTVNSVRCVRGTIALGRGTRARWHQILCKAPTPRACQLRTCCTALRSAPHTHRALGDAHCHVADFAVIVLRAAAHQLKSPAFWAICSIMDCMVEACSVSMPQRNLICGGGSSQTPNQALAAGHGSTATEQARARGGVLRAGIAPLHTRRGCFPGGHAPLRTWAPSTPRAYLAGNDEQGRARKVARHNGIAAVGELSKL